MKSKIAIIILALISIGLCAALIARQKKAETQRAELEAQIAKQSKDLLETSGKLEEQRQVNASLQSNLATRSTEMSTLSNNLNKVIADLEKSDAQAKATAEQLRLAQAELTRKDTRINELEGERTALGKQMDQLTNSISDLEKQIVATEQKLASAEGDKQFLLAELKRLQAEKAELERQFNDLAVLRAQVSKLKEELAIARRLEFIRLNLFGGTAKGGAERLMPHANKPPTPLPPPALDVEIRQASGARVVPPTNAPSPGAAPK